MKFSYCTTLLVCALKLHTNNVAYLMVEFIAELPAHRLVVTLGPYVADSDVLHVNT